VQRGTSISIEVRGHKISVGQFQCLQEMFLLCQAAMYSDFLLNCTAHKYTYLLDRNHLKSDQWPVKMGKVSSLSNTLPYRSEYIMQVRYEATIYV